MPDHSSSDEGVHYRLAPPPAPVTAPYGLFPKSSYGPGAGSQYGMLIAEQAAEQVIAAKAAALAALAGAATGPVTAVPGGFVQSYVGCDIYASGSSAFEVHGDIRAKYLALHGPAGVLGLPTTDETGTPDGVGRYNHFAGGSIYWTPHTGPMMVRGAIREVWARQGWERGPLGYPVEDEHQMALAGPPIAWNVFENGAILSSADGTAQAVTAQFAPDVLLRFIRKTFDDAFHKPNSDGSGNDIGLQPAVEALSISGWSYGFWKSAPRAITVRLHGFHDNGLAPDTNFTIDLGLVFETFWNATLSEPANKTIAVGVTAISVTASGLGQSELADGVASGVHDSFYPKDGPDPARPWVPAGWLAVTDIKTGASSSTDASTIDFLGVMLAADGSLQILLNPEPVPAGGGQRKLVAQNMIGKMTEDL